MPFNCFELGSSGAKIITPIKFEDNRGFYMETYKKLDFENIGITDNFIQDNLSQSKYNVFRGLHFQVKPYAQSKLVKCVYGEILDIIVDIRPESETYKKHWKIILNDISQKMVYVPEGFAHGFLTISDNALLSYKVNREWHKISERILKYNDPELNIVLPGNDFIMSDKDKNGKNLNELIKE